MGDVPSTLLLSEDGVIKGQYSTMGDTYVNWTRDDT